MLNKATQNMIVYFLAKLIRHHKDSQAASFNEWWKVYAKHMNQIVSIENMDTVKALFAMCYVQGRTDERMIQGQFEDDDLHGEG